MSTLVDQIKGQMKDAMKAKDTVAKDVLRVILSEIQLAEARAGADLDDDAGHKVVRKLIASNEATIEAARDDATKERLCRENQILEALVPKQLSVEQIVAALETVRDKIAGAKADGPAMGIAMKHLKSTGAPVDGDSVKAAVSQIRAG